MENTLLSPFLSFISYMNLNIIRVKIRVSFQDFINGSNKNDK